MGTEWWLAFECGFLVGFFLAFGLFIAMTFRQRDDDDG